MQFAVKPLGMTTTDCHIEVNRDPKHPRFEFLCARFQVLAFFVERKIEFLCQRHHKTKGKRSICNNVEVRTPHTHGALDMLRRCECRESCGGTLDIAKYPSSQVVFSGRPATDVCFFSALE
jgi:hypothetical protein